MESLRRTAAAHPGHKFVGLFELLTRPDFLEVAFRRSASNAGTPGLGGLSFADIEETGVDRYLADLRERLRAGTYRPSPVLRVEIPKSNGKKRPLGVPTIPDRTAQVAAHLVLSPVFDPRFPDSMHGFRPSRGVQSAVLVARRLLEAGYEYVVTADLEAYYDNIPHEPLLREVARVVHDGRLLRLLRSWLECLVAVPGPRGFRFIRPWQKKSTPQGACISPLLANVFMARVLRALEQEGVPNEDCIPIIYADDVNLFSRNSNTAKRVLETLRRVLPHHGLRLNEGKTHVLFAPKNTLFLLGHEFHASTPGSPYTVLPLFETVSLAIERLKNILSSEKSIEVKNRDIKCFLAGWKAAYSSCTVQSPEAPLRAFLKGATAESWEGYRPAVPWDFVPSELHAELESGDAGAVAATGVGSYMDVLPPDDLTFLSDIDPDPADGPHTAERRLP